MSESLQNYFIMNKSSNKEQECRLHWLNQNHISDILRLQSGMAASMTGASTYYPQSEAELREMFASNGMAVGAFVRDQLIGFHTAVVPGVSDENLGKDLRLPESMLTRVVHLENSSVDPDFRGNSLQQRMGEQLIKAFDESGRYRYVCETVAPDNVASIRSTLANRLWIVSLKKKYGGYWRYLFLRDLVKPMLPLDGIEESVEFSDYSRQLDLFKQNYIAVGVERVSERLNIRFVKYMRSE